uniref:Uncharacterized protein n=1 Tax=Oryza sativa subsp. japonica TaxID=39947 RepID=Q6H7C0_ORYSJ|nr:hypothetical protein [Oryza sativa Japonica Group]
MRALLSSLRPAPVRRFLSVPARGGRRGERDEDDERWGEIRRKKMRDEDRVKFVT